MWVRNFKFHTYKHPCMSCIHNNNTLNSAYNRKKYAEILLHYRWLFVKGNVFIDERVYLVQRFSFVIGDFLLKATSL